MGTVSENFMISILIPTCKTENEINQQIQDIEATTISKYEIIYSCTKNSASVNRNICLNKASYDIIIMMDDDISGFFHGWDMELIKALDSPDVILASARLLNSSKDIGFMMGDTGDTTSALVTAIKVPTACVTFKKNILRFDENFIGSGFEDDDFLKQMNQLFPDKRIVINNDCKLIHLNEMKNQQGSFWEHNKNYFYSKYPSEPHVH